MREVRYQPVEDMIKETTTSDGRVSCRTILVFVLLIIVIGLIVLIALTYGLELQCDDDRESKSDSNNSISFLLFSDIHLDPYYKAVSDTGKHSFCRNISKISVYNATYGRVGCDSPVSLLRQVLSAMKEKARVLPRLDFLMLSGDTCAHQLTTNRRTVALRLMKVTSQAVRLNFPKIPYFPSIGNNDLPGHYVMPGENDTWYKDLLDIWRDGILCEHCNMTYRTTTAEKLNETFLYGGYYSVAIAGDTMKLLVLNSMYWTLSTWKKDNYFQERAMKQMNWLEEQLKLANLTNKKVIITSHIPPGVDSYARKTLWLSNFTDLYMDLVARQFSDVVAGQIYAHFHKDDFRYLQADMNENKSSYILVVPSVSPVYRNYPNYRLFQLDPDLRAVVDYEQWYMNLVIATEFNNPVWQLDYQFSSRYPSSGDADRVINGRRIKYLVDNLISQSSDGYFNSYISSRQVRFQPDHYSRFEYYCATRYYKQTDFDACLKKYPVIGG